MCPDDHLLDGAFGYLRARELRQWDVLFNPVRQVVGDPMDTGPETVEVETTAGQHECASNVLLWAYRPTNARTRCDECGAEPGVACNPATCCALEMLADVAEAVRVRHER